MNLHRAAFPKLICAVIFYFTGFCPHIMGQLGLVSKPVFQIPNSFGDSTALELSADGKWAVFYSSGNGLATNDHNGFHLDLFLRNMESGATKLISRGLSGASANGDSIEPIISADGRYVVFTSDAPDFIVGDDNESSDIFLFDNTTGEVKAISLTSEGIIADGSSYTPVMTPDASYILFQSDADDLSELATEGSENLYLYNRASDELSLVTVNSDGTGGAMMPDSALGEETFTSMSSDGSLVAFTSMATNLVPYSAFSGLTSIQPQIYLWDRNTGTNLLITRETGGKAAKQPSTSPVLSDNGAVLAFLSDSTSFGLPKTSTHTYLYYYNVADHQLNVVPTPDPSYLLPNDFSSISISADGGTIAYTWNNKIYVWDVVSKVNRQITTSPSAVSDLPSISADGHLLTFISTATDLDSIALDGLGYQYFAYDLVSGTSQLLSRSMDGNGGANSDVLFPFLARDAAVAGFTTSASNLSVNDNPGVNDVYVVAISTNSSPVLASIASAEVVSATANGASDLGSKALTADGLVVVFTSKANNLVTDDDNGLEDVFYRDLATGITHLVSDANDKVHSANGTSSEVAISSNGKTIAFTSTATDIVATPMQVNSALYIYDRVSGSNRFASFGTNETVMTDASNPILSADGNRVLFLGKRAAGPASITELCLRDLLEQKTIWSIPADSGYTSILNSDGTLVAFGTSASSIPLRVYNTETEQTVTIPTTSARTPVAFTPDGKTLVALLGGTTLRVLDLEQNTGVSVSTRVRRQTLSADGKSLVYWLGSSTNNVLIRYDMETGITNEISLPSGLDLGTLTGDIALSADGKTIGYSAIRTNSNFSSVYIFDTQGGNVGIANQPIGPGVIPGGANNVSISADGKTVVFESSEDNLIANDLNLLPDIFSFHFTLTITDSDGDGLDDAWEVANNGNLDLLPEGDPDGDGFTNLQEFKAGTNPNDNQSALSLAVMVQEPGTLLIESKTVPGKQYQLQSTSNAGDENWVDVGSPITASGNSAQFQPSIGAEGSMFFRVSLIQ